jgi:sulfatase maturation enzyme AslB (radical SAM superfamily)
MRPGAHAGWLRAVGADTGDRQTQEAVGDAMSGPLSPVADLTSLQLVLTAGCNLRCSYCYENDKKNRSISWDVVRVALDRLLASPHSDVRVLFIGGEPLLEFPMIERAVAYLAERQRPDMSIRKAIITNGLLLGERETQFLVDQEFFVKLSFDGVPAAQRLRGEHTFAKLDELLDRLRDQQPGFYDDHLKINLTLLPETLPYLADSVEYFVNEKYVQDLSIAAEFTAASQWQPERIEELDREFRRVFRISRRRFDETGEVPVEVFRKSGGRRPRRPAARSMCGVGSGSQLAVDVDGQAHGCLTFVESYQTFPTTFLRSRVEAMRLGDVRDINFKYRLKAYPAAVEAAQIFHHKEEKHSSYGKCAECRYLADCSVCPMSIGRAEGQNDPHLVPDFICAFNLVSLKYRTRFPKTRSLVERLAGPFGDARRMSWSGSR